MLKELAVAGVLLVAAGCGSSGAAAPAKTVTATPTPSVSFDEMGSTACRDAAKGAWLAARNEAKLSSIAALQDVALREEKLGNQSLIKAWCQQNYRG